MTGKIKPRKSDSGGNRQEFLGAMPDISGMHRNRGRHVHLCLRCPRGKAGYRQCFNPTCFRETNQPCEKHKESQ